MSAASTQYLRGPPAVFLIGVEENAPNLIKFMNNSRLESTYGKSAPAICVAR